MRPLRIIGFGIFGLGCAGALVLAGFSLSYFQIGPFTGLADRVSAKLDELRDVPTESEARFDLIETTNVRLRGEVYRIERQDFSSGGALAVWGDDLLVITRRGTVRRLIEGEGIVETDIETPENGLADYEAVAASEEFSSYTHKAFQVRFNDLVYVEDGARDLRGLAVSYTFFDADRLCYGSHVAWTEIGPDVVSAATFAVGEEDWEILFETQPCLELNPTRTALEGIMAGGRMVYDARTGELFYGSGEYHLDGVHTYDIGIQSDDNDYGKVIAISLESFESRHVSIGHRNMQGMALDNQGRLWTTEHMIRGGDELNLIEEGGNYGWPIETYGTLYSGQPWPGGGNDGRHDIHTAPAFAWLPSPGVSTLTAIDGFHPTWDGDLLAGSLSTPAVGQSLYRIRTEGDRVAFVERIELERRIRYVTQWGDRIAVMMDGNDIAIFRSEERVDIVGRVLASLEPDLAPDVHADVAVLVQGCNECHGFERGAGSAPNLGTVFGREIGRGPYTDYSPALENAAGVWDRDALTAYLTDPESFIPGTYMPAANLTPGPALDGLLDFLERTGQEDGAQLPYN